MDWVVLDNYRTPQHLRRHKTFLCLYYSNATRSHFQGDEMIVDFHPYGDITKHPHEAPLEQSEPSNPPDMPSSDYVRLRHEQLLEKRFLLGLSDAEKKEWKCIEAFFVEEEKSAEKELIPVKCYSCLAAVEMLESLFYEPLL